MTGVTFEHTNYKLRKVQIGLVRDIYDGSDTAKLHLNQFPQEADDAFATRMDNVSLRNFTKRASEAFTGMIFRKPMTIDGYSNRVKDLFAKIDKQKTIGQVSTDLSNKLIRDGKSFILVDSDGFNPYFVILDRAAVINWKKDSSGKFTLIVIKEIVSEDSTDNDFETVEIEQYRVYKGNGSQDIYREDKDDFKLYETIETDIDYIPIVELELSDIPPLYDIAKLNIKHMNRTSAKDRYLDMSACPVPIIWGADIDDEGEMSSAKPAFVIGVDEAFIFNGTKDECDFQWRELSGSSIDQLQQDLTVIEKDITTGVIRAAQSDSTVMKTATQAYYESAESSNRVTAIANVVEYGLNTAVEMLMDFLNEPLSTSGSIVLNKDYNSIAGNGSDMRLLWEMYIGGSLSIETLLTSLEQFELVTLGTPEDELKRIENKTFKPEPIVGDKEIQDKTDNKVVI